MNAYDSVNVRWAVAVLTAAAVGAAASQAAGQQGRTTRVGEPPDITAGGQTNWTSHNLDLDNSRYSELGEVNTETVGGLPGPWRCVVVCITRGLPLSCALSHSGRYSGW